MIVDEELGRHVSSFWTLGLEQREIVGTCDRGKETIKVYKRAYTFLNCTSYLNVIIIDG